MQPPSADLTLNPEICKNCLFLNGNVRKLQVSSLCCYLTKHRTRQRRKCSSCLFLLFSFSKNIVLACCIRRLKTQRFQQCKCVIMLISIFSFADKPHNPMVNAGAIVCTSLIKVSCIYILFWKHAPQSDIYHFLSLNVDFVFMSGLTSVSDKSFCSWFLTAAWKLCPKRISLK